jgi:fructose/tagatose bisphosphate aldolase
MLAAAAIAAARAASVPVGVHLDHATDVEDIRDCLALAGDEDTSTGAKALFLLTDLEHAREFVERTSVDALATAVGTVHGLTTAPVAIDLDGLHTIAKLKNLPQVLHGASGLADSQVRAAVDAGVARVNINAELRRAYLAALATALAQASDDLRQVQRQTVTAMAEVAADKLTLLGGGGQTGGQARKGLR